MILGILGAGNMGGAIACGYADWLSEQGAAGESGIDATDVAEDESCDESCTEDSVGDEDKAGGGNRGGDEVVLYDPDTEKTKALALTHSVRVAESESELVGVSDAIILAIKPQMFGEVIPRIADIVGAGGAGDETGGENVSDHTPSGAQASPRYAGGAGDETVGENVSDHTPSGAQASPRYAGKIFVSIAAGISVGWLERTLGEGAKVVRVMPNTPAMVGEGMAALARSSSVTDEEFGDIMRVFDTVGLTAEVDESELDTVTGISGSSPAYAYMYMQALIESGKRGGLDEKTARLFAAQSTIGAARMVLSNENVSVEQLRTNVCSPGGTTIEAVNVLEREGFMDTIKRAVYACTEKSKRMKV